MSKKVSAVAPVVIPAVSPQPVVSPVDSILTTEELAARLKVSVEYISEKTRSRCARPLPCIRLGRYIRFSWASVQAWLVQQEGVLTTKRSYRKRRARKAVA